MPSAALLEQLVALHAAHGEAHRRMLAALEANDMLGLVEANRRQGALCTEQGVLLAEYVAAIVTTMPQLDAADRERVQELARHLRKDHVTAGKAAAG
jgi:hypothetical protein